ncbi:MAG: hypothetical protein V4719_11505 [Planctomycetota bacterium]
MSATEKKDQFRLGFLTAMEVPEQGFVGGLLITNRHGRPLEFQCTAPLKPNRTQEILYGTTLGPYVMGEVIARTLVEKVGVKPHLILTERTEILELRSHVSMPIGCLDADQSGKSESDPEPGFKIGKQWFRVHSAHTTDRGELESQTTQVPKDADMREPFERVREALLETVKNGK